MNAANIISKQELLQHWLGHRALTKKTVEAFPEEQLFNFSIGGMRPFADMIKEIIAIASPGLGQMITDEIPVFDHDIPLNTKVELLERWDQETEKIINLYEQIPESRFKEFVNLFGAYNFEIIHNILYAIDNEIHHRAQGYVYLRALNIEPPFFWER